MTPEQFTQFMENFNVIKTLMSYMFSAIALFCGCVVAILIILITRKEIEE
jgi:hypothetical protein